MVSVCVVTFKRPNLLRRLLQSLSELDPISGESHEIIVVDNDVLGSARSVCAGFSKPGIRYAIEPVRGIARARNRAVSMASGGAIAFIDDDERASPAWLRMLVETASVSDADIVAGPVLPEYAAGAPSWVRLAGVHDRPRHKSGTRVEAVSTANVLIARRVLPKHQKAFDEAFGLAGGSDRDLLMRLAKEGAKNIWEDAAEVYEYVPLERCRARWIVQRTFRVGLTDAQVARKHRGQLVGMRIGVAGLAAMFLVGVTFPFAFVFGIRVGIRWLRKGVRGCGKVMGALGWTFEEYRHFMTGDQAP